MTAVAAHWIPDAPTGDRARCAAMLAAQARYGGGSGGGGDGGTVVEVDGAALGRDLAHLLPEDRFDRQPLTDAARGLTMVADVRLDDRAELAAALGVSRIEAVALADSALLFTAWLRWGEGALGRVAGDYSLIVYDARARRLTIARDALGGRPLFWWRSGTRTGVASMPIGLNAAGAPRMPDERRVARLLTVLPSDERSFFEGIKRVEPGHLVRFDAGGRIEVRRHWEPSLADLRLPRFGDYVDAFREHLDRAVQTRLHRADGPIAAQLSGGWDSGAVVGTAAPLLAQRGERLLAYTHVPRRGADAGSAAHRFADEGPLAAAVAVMHGVEHRRIEGQGRSPLAGLDRDLTLFERPIMNLCNHVWVTAIRDDARARGVRVLLTGDIGNFTISAAPATVLADLIRRGRWRDWARESAYAVRDRRARVRGVLASSFGPWLPTVMWRQLEKLSKAGPSDDYALLHPAWRARLEGERRAAERDFRPRNYAAGALALIRGLDFADVRKGALAGWGIDERDPTADRRLVEFTLSLPPEMLLHDGVRRPLARAALADRVPAAVLDEKRKGYQAADWHEGLTADLAGVRALADRIAADPRTASVIDVDAMRRLIADWPTGGWSDPGVMARYRIALIRALSAGHFLVSA